MVDLQQIRAAAEAKAKAAAEAERLDLELRARIREAFADDNIRLKDLIEATGLSKPRLYQIRDGRRQSVEVILTVENDKGERSSVSATGKDYATAYEAARQLIPDGVRAIAIRTAN